jgi:hypothetical protein
MKVYFSLILPLALSTIIDLHIKLRCTTMVIEDHEKPLVEVVVFCKMGPATPEVHLAIFVVPHLYLVGSSSSRVFAKDFVTKFSPIHELSKLQRHPLNLMALSAGNVEEGIKFGRRRRRSITWQSARTWCSSLGLVLAPHRVARAPFHRHGWRGHRSRVFGFIFTAARMAATLLRHLRTDVQVRITSIGHGRQALGEETLDEMREKKMMRRRKIVMKELGVFPSQRALFITKLSWASAN